ncbi:TPA: RNA recognition motif domain-containing protein [Photobacterium damselae]|nr:RNA-binding protein [Photobacterium damselae]TBT70945.1 RNA-binding protein [Vibrio parahaemolyticus]ARR48186.1 RNA-binding protein [Photobacterium damselae subsp. damselae]AWK82998.1 RNA-binding protein [Photobacterium damselae]EHA1081759.1 RNA-binding protein [Photobacterium damselae]EJN6960962.1 RNA-binding protein [Photobacterium damselae]
MKLKNQILITIIAIAVVGALIFNAIAIPAALAFAIGTIISGLTVLFMLEGKVQPAPSLNNASKTLYVGNLPYRANESDVKELFSEYGEVFAVRLMKDKRTGKRRGFGFVVMASQEAELAVDKLNNKEYGQRTLKVREANEPKNMDNSDTE